MRVVGISCTLALLFATLGGAQTNESDGRLELRHSSWSIEELVSTADLIVAGKVHMADMPNSFGYRSLGLTIDTVIDGEPTSAPIYIIAPPPADGREPSPAILFSGARYLLFLVHDARSAQAASEFGVDPGSVLTVVGRWKGAVELDGAWPEVSNRLLDARGLLPQELRTGSPETKNKGNGTIELVRDIVTALHQPGTGVGRSSGSDQGAALGRVRASDHPWAATFLEERGEGAQAGPGE